MTILCIKSVKSTFHYKFCLYACISKAPSQVITYKGSMWKSQAVHPQIPIAKGRFQNLTGGCLAVGSGRLLLFWTMATAQNQQTTAGWVLKPSLK